MVYKERNIDKVRKPKKTKYWCWRFKAVDLGDLEYLIENRNPV